MWAHMGDGCHFVLLSAVCLSCSMWFQVHKLRFAFPLLSLIFYLRASSSYTLACAPCPSPPPPPTPPSPRPWPEYTQLRGCLQELYLRPAQVSSSPLRSLKCSDSCLWTWSDKAGDSPEYSWPLLVVAPVGKWRHQFSVDKLRLNSLSPVSTGTWRWVHCAQAVVPMKRFVLASMILIFLEDRQAGFYKMFYFYLFLMLALNNNALVLAHSAIKTKHFLYPGYKQV